MKLDIASDVFKALIIAACIFIVGYLRKNFKPFIKALAKVSKLLARVDELEVNLKVESEINLALVETDDCPIFINNATSGDLIYANTAWVELLGFKSAEDAYDTRWRKAIPESEIEKMDDIREDQVRHPYDFDEPITLQNIKTKELINRICRTKVIYKEGKPFKIIGRLLIIK